MSAGAWERESVGAASVETMAIQRVQELRVYDTAFEVAMRLFEASRSWPTEERYALTDQVRRASRAVCANLAEAWAKRTYPRHFVAKVTDAHGEAAETQVWIAFAQRCSYLAPDEARDLTTRCDHVIGALVPMSRQTDRWCGPAGIVRDPTASYFAT